MSTQGCFVQILAWAPRPRKGSRYIEKGSGEGGGFVQLHLLLLSFSVTCKESITQACQERTCRASHLKVGSTQAEHRNCISEYCTGKSGACKQNITNRSQEHTSRASHVHVRSEQAEHCICKSRACKPSITPAALLHTCKSGTTSVHWLPLCRISLCWPVVQNSTFLSVSTGHGKAGGRGPGEGHWGCQLQQVPVGAAALRGQDQARCAPGDLRRALSLYSVNDSVSSSGAKR